MMESSEEVWTKAEKIEKEQDKLKLQEKLNQSRYAEKYRKVYTDEKLGCLKESKKKEINWKCLQDFGQARKRRQINTSYQIKKGYVKCAKKNKEL